MKLQLLYVRLLYSGTTSILDDSIESQYLIGHLDSDRLEVEHKARVRNLRTVLYTDMRFLNRFVDKNFMLDVVQGYCGSKEFWQHRGRTLLEDFCLFFYEQLTLDPRLRLLAEIEGTSSGMSIDVMAKTPWCNHQQTGGNCIEYFAADYMISVSQLISELSLTAFAPAENKIYWKLSKKSDQLRIKVVRRLYE